MRYPHTDLVDTPPLHWHNVYSDLLALRSADDSVTAYVECFKRDETGEYHWEIISPIKTFSGQSYSLDNAISHCETIFDRLLDLTK